MKSNTQHKVRLRRLRVLQILSRFAPDPMGERALLNQLLIDPELDPTIDKIRDSLDYLAGQQLVSLVQVDQYEWMAAQITDHGTTWLQSDKDHNLEIYNPGYQPPELPPVYNGRTSKISKLPAETRAWLETQLIDRQFTGYTELTELLNKQGLEVKRSSLGRFAKKLKARVSKYKEKAEMVKSLAGVFENDAPAIMQGAMGTAVTAVLDAIEDGEYSTGKESLSSLVKALPALGRGFHEAEAHKIEQVARKKAFEDAATIVEEVAIAQGMDEEQVLIWRGKVLRGL